MKGQDDWLRDHVAANHSHMLPECFEKRPDVTWGQVHKLVHDLAKKKGEPQHTGEVKS